MNRTRRRLSIGTVAALVAGLFAVGATPLASVTPVQATGGEGWSALGTGMPNGRVFSIAPASNGMVYAGGTFTSAGGVSDTRNIAQWNPTVSAWQAVGSGVTNSGPNGANGGVFAVAHDPTTNRVFIGGDFAQVGDQSALWSRNFFAIWDVSNSSWATPLGQAGESLISRSFTYEGVEELAVVGSGQVYVGGVFRLNGDSTGDGFFRRTSVPAMAGVGSGITITGVNNGIVNGMVSDGGNGVVIGGQFDKVNGTGLAANKVARWDGTSWSAFGGATSGPADGLVAAVATTSGRVFIGGNFTKVQNAGTDVNSTRGLAMWNGTQWTSIGTMVGTVVEEMRVIGDYLYVGGEFNAIGGVTATNIARYKLSTATWEAITHGCTNGVNGVVRSIVDTGLGDGSIYVGGGFTDAGGVAEADRIAKYVPSTLGCSTGGSSVVEAPSNFRLAGLVRDRVDGRAGMRAHLAWDVPAGGGGANFFVVTTKGLRNATGLDESVEHPDLTCVTSEATCSIFFPFTSQVPSMNGRQYHQVIYSMQAYGLFGQSAPVSVGPLAQPDGTTASAPRNVQATAQWNRITVTWDEPASFGSAGFATNYLVTSQPSNRVCIVTIETFPATASARQCTFSNLRSRVDYTFTVQALTFNGWGAASAPTNKVAQLDLDVTSSLRTRPFFSFPGTSRIRVSGVASGYAAGTPVRTFMEIGTAGWREVRNANVRVDGSGRILFVDTISPLYARRTVGVRFEIDTRGRCGEPFASAGTCGTANSEVMRRVW